MTWNEYFNLLVSQGCSEENASNVIGRQMDIYEDYDWDHVVPFKVV